MAASAFEGAPIPHTTVDVPIAESELEDVPKLGTALDDPIDVDIAPAADTSDTADTIVVAAPFTVTPDAPVPRLIRSKRAPQVVPVAASASSLVPKDMFDAGGRRHLYGKVRDSSNVNKLLSNPRRNESAPNPYLSSYSRLQMTMRMVTMLQVTLNMEHPCLFYLQRRQKLALY